MMCRERYIHVMYLGGTKAVENFGDYAYYYNAFYGDKDYASEADNVDKILKKYSCTFAP